jgi:uncharacterized protein involved in exopolysaccharide biosynthesis
MDNETRQFLEHFKTEIRTTFDALEQRVAQLIGQSEQKVVGAQYRLAEAILQRLTQGEGNIAAFNARLASLEERLTELEKRLYVHTERPQ